MGQGAEQAQAQANHVTRQRRVNTTLILVFFKGVCWGNTFQWPLHCSSRWFWLKCLFVLSRPELAARDHPKFFFFFFLFLICHGDSSCKGHTCVAGSLRSGVQRCVTASTCLLSGLVCLFNCVHSNVSPAEANTDEETRKCGRKLQLNVVLEEL